MKAIRALKLVALLVFLSGCIPIRAKESPDISGVVTDHAAGSPIAGAKLCYEDSSNLVAVSNAQGSFIIPALHRWHFVWIGIDLEPIKILKVSATGYTSKEVAIDFGSPSEYSISLLRVAQ
jgi:hypothetical protein